MGELAVPVMVLLIVFLMAAAVAFTLYQEMPRVGFETQRDKEQLLIERGEHGHEALQRLDPRLQLQVLEQVEKPRLADTPRPAIDTVRAEEYFHIGSALDTGDESTREEAAAAYRKALEHDPYLVAAIINLAAEVAGAPAPRLYDGSWTEWASRGMPVAKGWAPTAVSIDVGRSQRWPCREPRAQLRVSARGRKRKHARKGGEDYRSRRAR